MPAILKTKGARKLSIPSPDLTKTFPRSPGEKLVGLAHLPRMIDKARARKNGTLGEYIYPCPLDDILLNFLGIESDKFMETLAMTEDEKVPDWAETMCANRSNGEKTLFNKIFLEKKPDTEKKWEKFYKIRANIDPSRTDVQTWAALIDLEEGRLPKFPSSSS